MVYEFVYISSSPLGNLFRVIAGVNVLFIFYHMKNARVPSRLLLFMSFSFLALANWLNGIAVSLPADQLYAVPLMFLLSTVLIIFNTVVFSAAVMHLFKKQLSNVDLIFLTLPAIAILVSLYLFPYEFQYYSYGWDISNYDLSMIIVPGPLIAITLLYVFKNTLPKLKELENDKLKKKMEIFLFGWLLSFFVWGISIGMSIMTKFPNISAITISIVFWFSQYPFFSEKIKTNP